MLVCNVSSFLHTKCLYFTVQLVMPVSCILMCCLCKVHKMNSKWVGHVCAHISSAQLLGKLCSRVGLAGYIETCAVNLLFVLITQQSLT